MKLAVATAALVLLAGCGDENGEGTQPTKVVKSSRLSAEFIEVEGVRYLCIVGDGPYSHAGGVWCERMVAR